MYSKEDILNFCFDTFDKDGSGTIDEEEFMNLCKAVNNANPMFPGNFTRALQEFDRNDDGLIDHDEFRELNKRYPLILFPAFRLQDAMQKKTLGEARWVSVHRIMFKKKQIEEYRQTHSGEFPPLTCGQSLRMKWTRVHPYESLFKTDLLKAAAAEQKAMAEPKRRGSTLAMSQKTSKKGAAGGAKGAKKGGGGKSEKGAKGARRSSTAGGGAATPKKSKKKGGAEGGGGASASKSRRSSTAGTPSGAGKKSKRRVAPGD